MKSSINVRYNVYAPKRTKERDSFESRHMDRLSARIKVKLPRGANSLEQMHSVTRALNSAVRSSVKRLHSAMKHKWLRDLTSL